MSRTWNNDRTAVAWKHDIHGGNASSVDLTEVVNIMCGGYTCVTHKNDGTAIACGPSVDLTDVVDIMCGGNANDARKNGGTAVA